MTTSNTPFAGLDGQIHDQTASLKALEGAAADTAEAMDQAFARAGQSMARSLARAASDGRISLGELASAILNAVNQAAGASSSGGVAGGLGGVLSQVLTAAGVSGARADGGAVVAGSAYLVGERGPEIFRPAVSGNVETGAPPQVNITLNVSGDGAALARSEAQIASALNRAARMVLR